MQRILISLVFGAHALKHTVSSYQWSMDDVSKGARTCKLITKWSRQGKFSCKHAPLFDFISMYRIVIDTHHLFLRISDVLTRLLIQDLPRADCIEKNQNFLKGLIEPNIHI